MAEIRAQCDKEVTLPHLTHRSVEETCFTDLACPAAHVSAFCRATISNVVPNDFWGGDHNRRMIMKSVDQFIQLRKFESLTLHQVTQGLQVFLRNDCYVRISTDWVLDYGCCLA